MDGRETDRLLFSRIQQADAPIILALLNEPGYHRHIGDRGLRTVNDAERYIRDTLTNTPDGCGFYLLRERSTGKPVGMAGLAKREFLDHPDLGYALFASREGRGFASEAAAEVYRFAKQSLQLDIVAAIVSPDNPGSIRVLERLGMDCMGPVAYPGEDDLLLYQV